MYIYRFTYMCIYIRISTHRCWTCIKLVMRTGVYMQNYIHTPIFILIYIRTCIYVYNRIHTYIHTYICAYFNCARHRRGSKSKTHSPYQGIELGSKTNYLVCLSTSAQVGLPRYQTFSSTLLLSVRWRWKIILLSLLVLRHAAGTLIAFHLFAVATWTATTLELGTSKAVLYAVLIEISQLHVNLLLDIFLKRSKVFVCLVTAALYGRWLQLRKRLSTVSKNTRIPLFPRIRQASSDFGELPHNLDRLQIWLVRRGVNPFVIGVTGHIA